MADTPRHLVPAHAARQDAGAHARRTRPSAIGGSRVAHEGDDVAIVACGITVDEAVTAAEALEGEGVARPRARLLLGQADRRRGACRRRRATAARSSPSRTTGPRAASATRCSRRWPTPTTPARHQAGRARDAGLGHARRSCCTRRASTRRRSPPPRVRRPREGASPAQPASSARLLGRELLGGVDAAQERAARLAGGLDLQPASAGRRRPQQVCSSVSSRVRSSRSMAPFIARPAAPAAARPPARRGRRARRPARPPRARVKTRSSGSRDSVTASTSSQVSGVDTVGCGSARSE